MTEIKTLIRNGDFSDLIELVFLPLYGKDGKVNRNDLAREVIDYEIDLLKNDLIYEKLVVATLVLCNKILDKNVLTHYYEEVKNMLKILEIARNDGMEKGMEKGILQTAKEMLVAALEEKIGVVPARIVDQIRSLDKHEVLSGLHRQAIKCNSFDTFEGKLNYAIS